MRKASQLLDIARARGVMIATAESCTAGMLAAAITDPAGASAIFDRGFVTYTNAAKTEMLGIGAETLAAHGAVSEPVATEMAQGALDNSAAHLAIAITGIAGPGGSGTKPEGRVAFAVARRGGPVTAETVEFGAPGRAQVREAAVDHALGMLLAAVASVGDR